MSVCFEAYNREITVLGPQRAFANLCPACQVVIRSNRLIYDSLGLDEIRDANPCMRRDGR